jgi:cytidylate kinase
MAVDPLAELFGRQASRWAIEGRAGMPKLRGAVVSISQQPFSGGDEIAARVSEWLDYGLFGLETLREIARNPALRAQLAADLDADLLRTIETRVQPLFEALDETELRDLARVLSTLGERGMAVVVGNGALSILPRERTLRVLVVAPREERVRRAIERLAQDGEQAARHVEQEDAARLAFLRDRLGLGSAGDDATLYDVVLNTELLSFHAAAALIVDALRRRFPPAAPAGT